MFLSGPHTVRAPAGLRRELHWPAARAGFAARARRCLPGRRNAARRDVDLVHYVVYEEARSSIHDTVLKMFVQSDSLLNLS